MAKYPPYVNAYGKISDVFEAIKGASVPPKFTNDFLSTVLGLKSSSYRAMVPLLKKLDFLDQNSVPTETYKSYREDSVSKSVLAEKVKDAYSDLYRASEYAHKLEKEELNSKLKTLLGVGNDDKALPYVIGTFIELVKLSEFDVKKSNKSPHSSKKPEETTQPPKETSLPPKTEDEHISIKRKFGISYTINLNLPATTEIEVYNSIFKALKDNLLDE
ncbi:MAG: DUF5343 domain-containing protein [Saprospiraceae bacterium]|nr:DUF5343 domain-containing protein [Saprospiraceae bacterium]